MTDRAALDRILAVQLTVAWAGEGRCVPPRLGWWATDLVDAAGGGDFFARVVPRTHAWAALEAVRHAGYLTDRRARLAMDRPDDVRTLFHGGFDLDEALAERLAYHKGTGRAYGNGLLGGLPSTVVEPAVPRAVLPALFDGVVRHPRPGAAPCDEGPTRVTGEVPFDRAGLAVWLTADAGVAGETPAARVARLAAALVPFAPRYPMPFVRVTA